MNTRHLLVPVLLVCELLAACAPAATQPPAPAPSQSPATQAPTVTPMVTAPPPTKSAPTLVTVDLDQVADITDNFETIAVDLMGDRVPVFAFNSIWLLMDTTGTITRWDPETRQTLATIALGDPAKAPYGDPVAAVATDDGLWVTSVAAHELVNIDPATNQIVEHIPIPDPDFFTNQMVLAGNTAWLWDYDKKLAQGIDLDTGQVIQTFPYVGSVDIFGDLLYLGGQSGSPRLVDPQTGQVVRELPGSLFPSVSADGDLWGFPISGDFISRIDPETFRAISMIKLGVPVRDLKFVEGSLWVTVSPGAPPACHNRSYLIQIDPKTMAAIGKIALDCPFDIIPYQDGIWVTVGDENHLSLTYVQP